MGKTKQKKHRQRWTRKEDELLIRAVETYGTKNWWLIASYVQGRTARQCRERYISYLDPNISKKRFTPEEDQTIMQLHEILGNEWALIASLLPGRTDVQVQNRFKLLQRRQAKAKKLQTKSKNRQVKLVIPQELQQNTAQRPMPQPIPQPIPQPEDQTNQTVEKTYTPNIEFPSSLPEPISLFPPYSELSMNEIILPIDFPLSLELENQSTDMPFPNPADTNREVEGSTGSNDETYQNIANASEEFKQKVANKGQGEDFFTSIYG